MYISNFKETVGDGLTTSKLTIKSITADMEGNYTCMPQYESLVLEEKSAWLTVLSKWRNNDGLI